MVDSFETPSGKNKNTENFPVGSWLIRPDLRPHVHAFYNFARAADDISDHPLMDPAEKLKRLNRMGTILDNMQDVGEDAPAAAAMRFDLQATGITAQHCHDLLTAFKRDATKLRYASWEELMDYCRYSASPVGRHVLALHGIGDKIWPANDALCSALQVINHIQDCADDYRELDRVYIPADMLDLHHGNVSDLSRTELTPALRATVNDMLDKLAPMLEHARSLPRTCPDIRLKLETSVICALAENLVRLLYRRDPLRDPVKLSKPRMATAGLWGLLRAFA